MSSFVYATMLLEYNNNNNYTIKENKDISFFSNNQTIKNIGRKLWKLYEVKFDDPIDEIIKKFELETILELWPEQYADWKKKQHNYEKEICSICLEYCNDAPMYVKCGHAYHQNCIEEWLSSKTSCPICREKI
tara:strand:- start:50 stop:448 length:399 start_codon:yes stop_codon:yes gene_type:complete